MNQDKINYIIEQIERLEWSISEDTKLLNEMKALIQYENQQQIMKEVA